MTETVSTDTSMKETSRILGRSLNHPVQKAYAAESISMRLSERLLCRHTLPIRPSQRSSD